MCFVFNFSWLVNIWNFPVSSIWYQEKQSYFKRIRSTIKLISIITPPITATIKSALENNSNNPLMVIPNPITAKNTKVPNSICFVFINIFSTFLHYLKNNISLDTIPSFPRIHLANAAARGCVKVSCGICIHTVVIMQEKLDHSYPQDYSLYGVIS